MRCERANLPAFQCYYSSDPVGRKASTSYKSDVDAMHYVPLCATVFKFHTYSRGIKFPGIAQILLLTFSWTLLKGGLSNFA